jgi:hypothetical protein
MFDQRNWGVGRENFIEMCFTDVGHERLHTGFVWLRLNFECVINTVQQIHEEFWRWTAISVWMKGVSLHSVSPNLCKVLWPWNTHRKIHEEGQFHGSVKNCYFRLPLDNWFSIISIATKRCVRAVCFQWPWLPASPGIQLRRGCLRALKPKRI